jgi:hypothetical protein
MAATPRAAMHCTSRAASTAPSTSVRAHGIIRHETAKADYGDADRKKTIHRMLLFVWEDPPPRCVLTANGLPERHATGFKIGISRTLNEGY